MDGDAARLDQLVERVGDLLAEPLLHREAAREQAHQPGELRDADDLVAGDVADVRDAVERQRVVLAEAEERDRPLDDLAGEPSTTLRRLARERGQQLLVAVVAGGRIVQRPEEPRRRLARAGRVEIHAERREDLADVLLEAPPLRGRDVAGRGVAIRFGRLPQVDDASRSTSTSRSRCDGGAGAPAGMQSGTSATAQPIATHAYAAGAPAARQTPSTASCVLMPKLASTRDGGPVVVRQPRSARRRGDAARRTARPAGPAARTRRA